MEKENSESLIKILASVVLYNPDEQAFLNLKKICDCQYFNEIYIVDKSEKSNKDKVSLISTKIKYLFYSKNLGIAKALKDIMSYSLDKNYDYTLTLDQDSVFPLERMKEIYFILKKNINSSIGIISLNYNNKYFSHNNWLKVKSIITSGNFIKNDCYRLIDGFNENLFIDYVDFDLCNQFYKNKIEIYVITNISINHTIGNPTYKKIFFFKVKLSNHSPIRYYYRYRNELYCFLKDRKFYFKHHIKELICYFLIILFEKNKKEKIKMIKLGKKDAKKNKLGVYNPQIEVCD